MKIFHLALAVVYSFSFASEAMGGTESPVHGHPLTQITCETLLHPDLLSLGTRETALSTLRLFSLSLPRTEQIYRSVPTDFYTFRGNLNSMPEETIAQAEFRLADIESRMERPDFSKPMIVAEFRGEQFYQAAAMIDEIRNQISADYVQRGLAAQGLAAKINSLSWPLFKMTMLSVLAFANYNVAQNFGFGDPATVLLMGSSLFSFLGIETVDAVYQAHESYRFDRSFNPLTEFLKNGNEHEVFMSGFDFLAPNALHRAFLGSSPNPELAKSASFRFMSVDLFHANKGLKELINYELSGERLLTVLSVDHLVGFDPQTNEPVWLMVYRVKDEQAKRRPPKRKREPEKKLAPTPVWVPAPIPVR